MGALLAVLVSAFTAVWPFGHDPEEEHARIQARAEAKYPASRYLWAVGESDSSPEEALLRARSGVADQLGFSITSSLTSRLRETSKGTRGELSSDVLWVSRKESRFEQAQLIRTEPVRRAGKGWIALAYLSRSRVHGTLVKEAQDSVQRLRRAAQEALAAPDVESFATSWQESLRLGEWLQGHWTRMEGLAPEDGRGIADDSLKERTRQLLERLERQRKARLLGIRVRVQAQDGQLRSRLQQGVREAGFSLGDSSSPWELSLEWERSLSRSEIGSIQRCRLVPVLGLRYQGRLLEERREPGLPVEGFGIHDAEEACAQALERAGQEGAKEAAVRLLATYFPLR